MCTGCDSSPTRDRSAESTAGNRKPGDRDREPGEGCNPRLVLDLDRLVFCCPLLIQRFDRALGLNRTPYTLDSMPWLVDWCAPKCHYAIANKLIKRCIAF